MAVPQPRDILNALRIAFAANILKPDLRNKLRFAIGCRESLYMGSSCAWPGRWFVLVHARGMGFTLDAFSGVGRFLDKLSLGFAYTR